MLFKGQTKVITSGTRKRNLKIILYQNAGISGVLSTVSIRLVTKTGFCGPFNLLGQQPIIDSEIELVETQSYSHSITSCFQIKVLQFFQVELHFFDQKSIRETIPSIRKEERKRKKSIQHLFTAQ